MLIAVKPIIRPMYSNRSVLDFATWRQVNLAALTDYWNSLLATGGQQDSEDADFELFTHIQHESELDRREEYKRAYGSWRDTL